MYCRAVLSVRTNEMVKYQKELFLKIPSLQVLRAIAAWSVVYHHYMQIFYNFQSDSYIGKFFSLRGNFGVDLFFLLSGFVMYLSASRPEATAGSFFLKRLFRVVPAYYFFTILAIAISVLIPNEFGFTKITPSSFFYSLLFIPHENPSGLGVFPYLTVGWTLNCEILFYTILSLCIFLNKRSAILLCTISVAALPLVLKYTTPTVLSVMRNHQIWQFLFGFWVAKIYLDKNSILFKSKASGVMLFVLASIMLSGVVGYGSLQRTIAAMAIILGFLIFDEDFDCKNKILSFIVRLGDYSYSTYLCHILVLCLFLHFFGHNLTPYQEVIILIAISISIYILSFYSYKIIERARLFTSIHKRLTLRQS